MVSDQPVDKWLRIRNEFEHSREVKQFKKSKHRTQVMRRNKMLLEHVIQERNITNQNDK